LHLVTHINDKNKIPSAIKEAINIVTHDMENFNFAKANNLVIKYTQGDVVLLNDDVEVTKHWLETLQRDSRGIALTGAHTGIKVSGNPHMWEKGETRTTWFPINMFCTYIPKRIINVVGMLDEEFCYYGGEDVDYSIRSLQHGFPLIISAAYINHKGNQSFKNKKEKLMEESNKIILEKYKVIPPFNLEKIKPLVSVIIATRNRSLLLHTSINSILRGLYKNIEVIVVDDESTDNSWEIIESLQQKDARIIGIKLPKSVGCVKAREYGCNLAKGTFIAFADDDDYAKENRIIAPLAYFFKNPDVDVVYCTFDIVTNAGRKQGRVKEFNADEYLKGKFDIGTGALLTRKDVIKNVPFMSLYERAIDYDWVFRVLRKGYKISFCPVSVLDYNRTGNVNSHLAGNFKSIGIHLSILSREKLLIKMKRTK